MSMDSRLLIENIPSLKGAQLCPFLHEMNNAEKAEQTKEQVIFDKAMTDRNYYYDRGGYCLYASAVPIVVFCVALLQEMVGNKLASVFLRLTQCQYSSHTHEKKTNSI